MHFTVVSLLVVLVLFISTGLLAVGNETDMSKYKDYLNDFMRVRGDASGSDVVFYWSGTVYSFVQGEKRQELFKFEGFNIAKTVLTDAGFIILTREAAFYEDPKTGQILENWTNPFNKKEVSVVQVWNDPVNQDIGFPDQYLPYVERFLPSVDIGDTRCYNLDIFPFYPSPLPRKLYPEYSQSDTYQAGEFFQFFVNKSDLANENLTTVPTFISWTRISPWMPFMQMADAPGNLIFVCRGMKLANGYSDLPKHLQDYVKNKHPEYSSPPTEWKEPNETSWTYFKKLIESGAYAPPKK